MKNEGLICNLCKYSEYFKEKNGKSEEKIFIVFLSFIQVSSPESFSPTFA